MAKPIIVRFEGRDSSFDHAKVERDRLYGRRVRQPLDEQGRPCERALVTDDGTLVLRHGALSQGYFDARGDRVPITELEGLDAQGRPVAYVPSTLGVAQPLEAVEAHVALELDVDAVHHLVPVEVDEALERALAEGQMFRFSFNYGSDYHAETAILVRNDQGYFCLVGVPLLPAWSELDRVPIVDDAEPGDLDFEMLLAPRQAMLRRIHITNATGRDAVVAMAFVPRERPPRLGLEGKPVAFRRYVAEPEPTRHEALRQKLGDDYANALISADPEVDRESEGRSIGPSQVLYLDGEGRPLEAAPRVAEIVFGPDGEERERREVRDVPANVHDDAPLRWTGRKLKASDAARRYCFRRAVQIFHIDPLSYDFLHAMARELSDERAVVLIGAGPKGADPLIFEANGRPYRGFLSGRLDPQNPARYRLLLHLSDMELKPPPPREADEPAAAKPPAAKAQSEKAPASKAPASKAPASKAPASKAPASKAPASKAPASKASAKPGAKAAAKPTTKSKKAGGSKPAKGAR